MQKSVIRQGFYFSSSADGSANDQTIYVDKLSTGLVMMSIRYKNAEPSHLYQAELTPADLALFGRMCIDMARAMEAPELDPTL